MLENVVIKLPEEGFVVGTPTLFEIFSIPIKSSLVTGFFVTFLALVFAMAVTGRIKANTSSIGRVQATLEIFYMALYDLTTKISGDEKVARKIINIIIAIVFYLVVSNLLLTLPFLGSLKYEGKDIFVTSTKDLNITFGLALTVVAWTHFTSIQRYGYNPFVHVYKFLGIDVLIANFRQGLGKGLMGIINIFISLLDIIGEFAKSLSLSLRLFGNMFAGEVLLALMVSFLAVAAPVLLMFYGIFAGFLQAIVFGSLAAAYFGAMLKE